MSIYYIFAGDIRSFMWYFQPSSGLCYSLQSIGLSPILGQGLWLFTLPQAQPLWSGPAARHARGAWRTAITNSFSQATGLPHAYTGIYLQQTHTLLSVFFFCFFTIPLPSAENIFSFFLFFFFNLKCEGEKNEGSDGSHFSSTFLFSLTSRFLALPLLPSPSLCVCVCVFLPHGWTSA